VALAESYETKRSPVVVDPSYDPVEVLHFAMSARRNGDRLALRCILSVR